MDYFSPRPQRHFSAISAVSSGRRSHANFLPQGRGMASAQPFQTLIVHNVCFEILCENFSLRGPRTGPIHHRRSFMDRLPGALFLSVLLESSTIAQNQSAQKSATSKTPSLSMPMAAPVFLEDARVHQHRYACQRRHRRPQCPGARARPTLSEARMQGTALGIRWRQPIGQLELSPCGSTF
jgi:hypothetical protein